MERMLTSVVTRCLCRVLAEAREKAGLTQTGLGERLLIGQPQVAKIEHGDRRLQDIELPELGQALGVGMVELVRQFDREIMRAAAPPPPPGPARSWRAR